MDTDEPGIVPVPVIRRKTMQPPSFDEFIRKRDSRHSEQGVEDEFQLVECPTPGCKSHAVHPAWDRERIIGFSCSNGCKFTAKRNAFTGEIIYYHLDDCNPAVVGSSVDAIGMKFSFLGEPYTDWY